MPMMSPCEQGVKYVSVLIFYIFKFEFDLMPFYFCSREAKLTQTLGENYARANPLYKRRACKR